jgi:PAS domain S-box-containing protein
LRPYTSNRVDGLAEAENKVLRAAFKKVESREWWLWAAAFTVTLLLTAGLVSTLLPHSIPLQTDFYTREVRPQAIRSLIILVLLFDLYTLYQQLLIHRVRKQILRRDELFQLISENAADMIAVVDMNGKRLFNSLSYQRLLGYTTEELQASSAFEQIHPDDRERVKKAAEQARRLGKGETLEYRFRHKNGSWLVLESTSSVIRNAKGEPERLVIVNRDITDHRRAGEALRRSEADFRSVVEHAPYGIYRATIAGRFLQANPALQKMLGYDSLPELLSRSLPAEIFGDEEEYRRFASLLTQNEETKDVEVEWRRTDGTPITVRCSGHHIDSETGTPAYFEVFAEDITEKLARAAIENGAKDGGDRTAVGRHRARF